MTSAYHEVKTVADLANEPEEYREAIAKIVVSHAVNELYGAQVFDEPAIAARADAVCEVAELPDRDGGVPPSRALQGTRR